MAEKKLPSMETTFDIHVTGEETGQVFSGSFRYRRPTLGDRTQIEVQRSRMSSDQVSISPDTADTLYILAFLKTTLKSFPDWWEANGFGSTLYDMNVVTAVYDKCLEFEKEWKVKVKGVSDALSKATIAE